MFSLSEQVALGNSYSYLQLGRPMNCQCGAEVGPSDTACRFCGLAVAFGVGGWLLFFILTLVFFSPASYIVAVLVGYRHTMESFSRSAHPYSLYQFYFVEQAVGLALCGYSIFAGIQLWKKRPGAVGNAKRFLVLLAIFRLADFVAGLDWAAIMGTRGTLSHFLSVGTWRIPLNSLLYVALWYSYLLRSIRVRNTFSPHGVASVPSGALTPE